MDYLVRILTEDVKLDFMCTHILCGFGFKGHRLCKAEGKGKRLAEAIPYEEAELAIEDVWENEIYLILYLDFLF